MVSVVTSSLNASLHTHAQTLALLELQRNTPNLPFQLINPGRTFLKRSALNHSERGAPLRSREFLLFSDCLLWLDNLDRTETESSERWERLSGGGVGNVSRLKPGA